MDRDLHRADCLDCGIPISASYSLDRVEKDAEWHELRHPTHIVHVRVGLGKYRERRCTPRR